MRYVRCKELQYYQITVTETKKITRYTRRADKSTLMKVSVKKNILVVTETKIVNLLKNRYTIETFNFIGRHLRIIMIAKEIIVTR